MQFSTATLRTSLALTLLSLPYAFALIDDAARKEFAACMLQTPDCDPMKKISMECGNGLNIKIDGENVDNDDTYKKIADCACATPGFNEALAKCSRKCGLQAEIQADCEVTKGANPAPSWKQGRSLLGTGAGVCVAAWIALA